MTPSPTTTPPQGAEPREDGDFLSPPPNSQSISLSAPAPTNGGGVISAEEIAYMRAEFDLCRKAEDLGIRRVLDIAWSDVERLLAALQPNPTQQGGAKWKHPDAVPQVKAGREEYRIVAVRRAHDGQVYRFPATYLNQCVLRFEDDNEERPVTGWFSAVTGEDGEGESYHELLCKGDVLEAWCDLPDAPSDAILAALKTEKA